MKTDKVYLERMLDAASQVRHYIQAANFKRFKSDRKTQSAVILQLIVIGEEAKKVSSGLKRRVRLPWKQIMGFRDQAVHKYFYLDLAIVWKTVKKDIPKLYKTLKECLVRLKF